MLWAAGGTAGLKGQHFCLCSRMGNTQEANRADDGERHRSPPAGAGRLLLLHKVRVEEKEAARC